MLAVVDVLQRFVFEQPWPLAIALAIVSAAVNVAGQRKRSKAMRRGSMAVAVVAGAVLALGYTLETGNEAVERHTHGLIDATAPLDLAAFQDLLADDARLLGADGDIWITGDEIVARLDNRVADLELDQRITGLTVQPVPGQPGQRRAELDLRTKTVNTGGLPLLTSWSLLWQRDADDPRVWRLLDARWLRFNQNPPTRDMIR